MKLQKNKIVFVLVLACVVLFITAYALLTFGKEKEPELNTDQIPLPDLEEPPMEYRSKLEALEAIKEERESTAPPMYPEHMVDDKGYFNPDYMEYEKQRIIDSLYIEEQKKHSRSLSSKQSLAPATPKPEINIPIVSDSSTLTKSIDSKVLGLEHQLFFASKPRANSKFSNEFPVVRVSGRQQIREGQRLELMLTSALTINGFHLPKYTRLYGFAKIRPNRVLVEVSRLGNHPIALKAYDLQDGKEGIYVENHLKGAIVNQGLDETIREVNIPGVPQLSGIKNIFRKDNRAIKVEIPNNYQFLLKP
ncbi:conjugative transposon protein TraM [Flagellimonas profundi]|uniref:Conjugative transposon protein TraM n=1 Tax=Flagellimonas profundi TaxID=2915620 RepID=A0ABS3FAK9_9FLAO|nr:conjugative transposon protein TraM [Allomuricauda profundi]MBO0340187.1 conjugative transposon protein TraM [Allomuricauda profundi]